jgi:hypothetical protein
MAATVEFENDRVKVLRVSHAGRERHAPTLRHDRLIIYLNEGRVRRSQGGRNEDVQRKTGEVVWRTRSQHDIENLNNAKHEVIIVEFKD